MLALNLLKYLILMPGERSLMLLLPAMKFKKGISFAQPVRMNVFRTYRNWVSSFFKEWGLRSFKNCNGSMPLLLLDYGQEMKFLKNEVC